MFEQGDVALAIDTQQDADDAEDDEVRITDHIIVAAITEDDFSHLEVQLFTDDGTLFVHHDINLPEFPLCLTWLDCPPFLVHGEQTMMGNYVAVGTFDPAIEIWNLDVLDPLEPIAVLGGTVPDKPVKKSKKKTVQYQPGSHEGAVMALSWNKLYRPAIASGSADSAVKIWDVTTQTCTCTFSHHTDKVQIYLILNIYLIDSMKICMVKLYVRYNVCCGIQVMVGC
jgi:periodic tryptophan protein 1